MRKPLRFVDWAGPSVLPTCSDAIALMVLVLVLVLVRVLVMLLVLLMVMFMISLIKI